jgi:hypothetical protein
MAKKLVVEMADGLDKYRSRVSNATLGAFGEYLKFRVAADAGLETDRDHGHLVNHWDLEWKRLLIKGLIPEVQVRVKFNKASRLDVALREIERLRIDEEVDTTYAEWARKQINKDFGVKLLRPVTPDASSFWHEVKDILETFLERKVIKKS